jgi:hypothetical protein
MFVLNDYFDLIWASKTCKNWLRNIDFLICGAGDRTIFLIKLKICEPLAGRDTFLIICCRRIPLFSNLFLSFFHGFPLFSYFFPFFFPGVSYLFQMLTFLNPKIRLRIQKIKSGSFWKIDVSIKKIFSKSIKSRNDPRIKTTKSKIIKLFIKNHTKVIVSSNTITLTLH